MIRDNIQISGIKKTINNHKITSNWSPVLGTLTYTSGRKLKISKCRLYLMEWKFHDDGRVILAHMSDITPFTIVSSFDNTKYVIKLLSNNDCMKYLGIQSTPLGNQNSQYKLSINCKDRCTYSRHRYFGRYYAELYLNTHLNL